MARPVVVRSMEKLQQEVRIGDHRLVADEPPELGGDGAGPQPGELVLAALGA